jgi:endonuclease/exonuclease/phosphatase (EEP) superfamily protein YafD
LVAAALAVAYVVALVVVVFAFRSLGEKWWLTALVLYLPRIGFLLPLPFVALLLFVCGPRKLLYSQAVALVVVLFPLMGLALPWPHAKGNPSFRVMSFNVDSLNFGWEKVASEIEARDPEIVVLQEIGSPNQDFLERLRKKFAEVHVSTQFLMATRFPVKQIVDPPRIPAYGRLRSPRFMRYVLETSLGPVVLYNVHPISPRWGFHSIRGQGFRKEILSGRLFAATNTEPLQEDNVLRGLQV